MNQLWTRLRHCFDLLSDGLKRLRLLEERIADLDARRRGRGTR